MNKKKKISIAATCIMLVLATIFLPIIIAAPNPCSVRGYVYVDSVITKPDQVVLSFPGQDITATLFDDPYGFYTADFAEEAGATGSFHVTVSGETYTALETVTIENGVTIYYPVNLTVNTSVTPVNELPNKPTTPLPNNNEPNVNLPVTLTVTVTDPDADSMDVAFYDDGDNYIGQDLNVASGTQASTTWYGLDYDTTYGWYAVADDNNAGINTSDIWTFTTKSAPLVNHAPNQPINPDPENNSNNIGLNPTLSVNVSDPDANNMDVSFYNATDHSLIGTATNIPSGDTASVQWTNLAYNSSYSWYAIADDSELQNQSATWTFKTRERTDIAPNVTITKPEPRSTYIFNLIRIPRLLNRILIIGSIDVEVDATDDTGIDKVEFYIDDETTPRHNATEEPYTWTWDERIFFKHTIKVIAYDEDGLTDTDTVEVFIFNLGII